MPLTFDTPQTVEPAKAATEVHCVGVNIRLPRGEAPVCTFYYEALDADGNVVERRPLHVPAADLAAKYGEAYTDTYATLKATAYQEAVDSGLFPTGTVV